MKFLFSYFSKYFLFFQYYFPRYFWFTCISNTLESRGLSFNPPWYSQKLNARRYLKFIYLFHPTSPPKKKIHTCTNQTPLVGIPSSTYGYLYSLYNSYTKQKVRERYSLFRFFLITSRFKKYTREIALAEKY